MSAFVYTSSKTSTLAWYLSNVRTTSTFPLCEATSRGDDPIWNKKKSLFVLIMWHVIYNTRTKYGGMEENESENIQQIM